MNISGLLNLGLADLEAFKNSLCSWQAFALLLLTRKYRYLPKNLQSCIYFQLSLLLPDLKICYLQIYTFRYDVLTFTRFCHQVYTRPIVEFLLALDGVTLSCGENSLKRVAFKGLYPSINRIRDSIFALKIMSIKRQGQLFWPISYHLI